MLYNAYVQTPLAKMAPYMHGTLIEQTAIVIWLLIWQTVPTLIKYSSSSLTAKVTYH